MENLPRRILLVDDDEDDYILTRAILAEARGEQFRLDWADTYSRALAAIKLGVYDAILMDYDLGGRTGIDLIRQVVGLGCETPIILLTGHGSYEVDVAAMKAGAVEYISKSEVTAPLLERSIRYAIERKRTEDALRRAQDELEQRVEERTLELSQANNLLEKVFSSIHLLIAHLDRDLKFVRVNRNYAESEGQSPEFFPGKYHFDLYPNAENEAIFRNVIATGEGYFVFARPFAYAAHPERGLTFWDWSLQPVKESDGRVSGAILSLVDVTERERAEQDLRASYEMFESLFQASPDSTILLDGDGVILRLNRQTEEKFGYSAQELIGQPVEMLMPEALRQVHPAKRAGYFVSPQPRPMGHERELSGRKKDGGEFPIDVTVSPLQQGSRQEIVCVIHDITHRKQVEAELAEVQRRLFDSLEAERVLLAQELHDGPVQELYAVTYHLTGLLDALGDEKSQQQLHAGQAAIQQVAHTLRTICRDLRPPALAPFGLEKAIRSHADLFLQDHPDIDLRLYLMSDGQSLPERQRLALFRIYQQALANVVRHANASRVEVRFTLTPEEIVLEIADNGVGFQAPERWITLARQGHLGLIGATERAEAIGGRLEMLSAPGEGTVIRVVAPRE